MIFINTEIADSGERREFPGGAVRDMSEGKGRFDLLPWDVIWDLAKHFEKGAIKYDANNWQKGIPASSFVDSAYRHLTKHVLGWHDEPHLIAAVWNLVCLAWTEKHKPECVDIPAILEANHDEAADH